MKKILFLGAAPAQIPPLIYAREKGYYVITCDYSPENPGHALAHKSFNVSTTDKEAVLLLAERLSIDAIVAYASDPAAPTAAFVAEKLGLPGNPYDSVLTLTRKDLFRRFLKLHGFNTPKSASFYDQEQGKQWLEYIGLPVFVKPVDSSGSKGVTELSEIKHFSKAFAHALNYSREKKVVIEEKIFRIGNQVAGDGFVVDGNLVFRCWANENFDLSCNGLVPIGQTFPTTHDEQLLDYAHAESQRLLSLLKIKQGALNFDFVFSDLGQVYFLEIGPRNGGCRIPEVIKHATGTDLTKYTVDAALGLDCSSLRFMKPSGYWASYMIHSNRVGIFKNLEISNNFKSKVVFLEMYIQPGRKVNKFIGSNDTLGEAILCFESNYEMQEAFQHMHNNLSVVLE